MLDRTPLGVDQLASVSFGKVIAAIRKKPPTSGESDFLLWRAHERERATTRLCDDPPRTTIEINSSTQKHTQTPSQLSRRLRILSGAQSESKEHKAPVTHPWEIRFWTKDKSRAPGSHTLKVASGEWLASIRRGKKRMAEEGIRSPRTLLPAHTLFSECRRAVLVRSKSLYGPDIKLTPVDSDWRYGL